MQRLSQELHGALAARLPVRAVCWGGGQALLPVFAPLAAARAAGWLVAGADVVLAGDAALTPLALALGRCFGRPVAAMVHGLDVVYPHPLYQALVPVALRRVDLVLAISESTRQLALSRGVEPSRCLAIPPAIDREATPPRAAARSALSRRFGVDLGERPVLLTIGRLTPRKGHAWFVRECLPRVLALRPDALYMIAGDGPERAAVEAAAAPLGAAVCLLGRVDATTRADLLGGSDLFVMPNVPRRGDAEGFGLVALEAAHAGLPTVATALDSIPEAVVDGVTGTVVRPGDAEAFADAVGRLVNDGAARRTLAEMARAEAAARFSWTTVGDRYAGALASLGAGLRANYA